MTEAPLVGLWCTGRSPLELAVSVHCSRKVMTILRKAGYSLCSCYTEITLPPSADKMKDAARTLKQLCLSSDLVLTFGCEGFAEGDIIPDVTEQVCTGRVTYFSNVLCGSVGVSAHGEEGGERSDGKMRIYPEEDEFERRAMARGRYRKNGLLTTKQEGAFKRFSGTSDDTVTDVTDDNENICSVMGKEDKLRFIKLRPSRATAGICEKALILNLTNDVVKACGAVDALLPAIGFTVYNLSGKSAALYISEENSLKATPEFQNFFTNDGIVNN